MIFKYLFFSFVFNLLIQTTQKDRENLESKIEQLEKQLAAETYARRLLETQNLQEKRDAEVRLRDAAMQVIFFFLQILFISFIILIF